MKYLCKYIKSLSDNIEEEKSKISNSKYYTIYNNNSLDKFVIRISDNFSPLKNFVYDDIDIVKVMDQDNFVIQYKDYRAPIIRNRKETKEFIRFAFDIFKMKSIRKESDRMSKKAVAILTDEELFDVKELDKTIACKWNSFSKEIDMLWKKKGIMNTDKNIFYNTFLSLYKKDIPLTREMRDIIFVYIDRKYLTRKEIIEVIFNARYLDTRRTFNEDKIKQYLYHKYLCKKEKTK